MTLRIFLLLTIILQGIWVPAALSAEARNPSGHPIPRFVTLKDTKTNARFGPSFDYPVRYVLRRQGLPVKVIEETRDNQWRKIVDHEGETMWINERMLTADRTALVHIADGTLLRMQPSFSAMARAQLDYGVLVTYTHCTDEWCAVSVGKFRGYVPQGSLWGINL